VIEQRPDFRTYSVEQSRTFPIAIQNRGWNALPGVIQTTLSSQGVWTDGVCLHNSKTGDARVIPRENNNLSIDRNRVTLTLLEALFMSNDDNLTTHTLSLQFDTTVESIDFQKHEIQVVSEDTSRSIGYDYLVAADGGKSTIRRTLVEKGCLKCETKEIPSDYRTLHLLRQAPPVVEKPTPKPSFFRRLWNWLFHRKGLPALQLDPNKIHGWRFANNDKCIGCPIHPGLVSCAYIFDKGQDPFVDFATPDDVLAYFRKISPGSLGRLVTQAEGKALLHRPTSTLMSVRCQALHHSASRVLLLGDAAHAVSASAGQGANSALQDVQIFCQVLQDTKHDWNTALPLYTDARLPDAHAVSEISDYTSPCNKWLQMEFVLRLIGRKVLPKWMLCPMPMELLNDTTKSYTEVLQQTQWWVDKVRRAMKQQGINDQR
jgi:kynurenine 3-monooxygenase